MRKRSRDAISVIGGELKNLFPDPLGPLHVIHQDRAVVRSFNQDQFIHRSTACRMESLGMTARNEAIVFAMEYQYGLMDSPDVFLGGNRLEWRLSDALGVVHDSVYVGRVKPLLDELISGHFLQCCE